MIASLGRCVCVFFGDSLVCMARAVLFIFDRMLKCVMLTVVRCVDCTSSELSERVQLAL